MNTSTVTRRATRAQIQYISDLLKQIPNWSDVLTGSARVTALNVWSNDIDDCVTHIPFVAADTALKVLVPMRPSKLSHTRPVSTAPAQHDNFTSLQATLKKINVGRYALPRKADGVVDCFEVIERKNGQRFLNQLLGGNVGGTKFHRKHLTTAVQASAARAILTDQKAAALLYADTYCECPRCGVALTHPRSKIARIGKTCAAHWGWHW